MEFASWLILHRVTRIFPGKGKDKGTDTDMGMADS